MKPLENDPLGEALIAFSLNPDMGSTLKVEAIDFDDDVLPVPYLFRTYDMMPELEKTALSLCAGKILDIGAGTGCHSFILKEKGFDVLAIESSPGACQILEKLNIPFQNEKIQRFKSPQKFDTILLLMNGIGLAERYDELPSFLTHLKGLLTDGGKIICDSTDLRYLYEGLTEDDLPNHYPGEITYRMCFHDNCSDWFTWLYLCPEDLENACKEVDLKMEIIFSGKQNEYLTVLTKK